MKDGAVLSNCDDVEVRKQWVVRITDHDGIGDAVGGIEAWIQLGQAVGLTREQITSLEMVSPGVRFAVDAYINFAKQRSWQESVCSSLTELFAPHIHQQRISSWPTMYPWIDESGLTYFRKRLTEARRDVEHGLEVTLDYFSTTREMQMKALEILQFKLNVLWVIADSIMLASTDITTEGVAYTRQPVIQIKLKHKEQKMTQNSLGESAVQQEVQAQGKNNGVAANITQTQPLWLLAELSMHDITEEINNFITNTKTFKLKQKVAAMIKDHGYPMVLNVVIHRYNIGHLKEILEMAEALGADYIELANTQYYGWSLVNRAQLMPQKEQVEEAERITNEFRERVGNKMKIFFVVPDYFGDRPKKCMNGWGETLKTLCYLKNRLSLEQMLTLKSMQKEIKSVLRIFTQSLSSLGVYALAALAALAPFAIDTYLPAFHVMSEALGANDVQIQQSLTFYLLPYAAMTLWHGAISDAIGRITTIKWGLTIFVLASIGCAFAPNVETLWFFRALQGASGGAGNTVARAMVRDLFEGPQAQRVMATVQMLFGIAPAVAPIIGGILLGINWQIIFIFLAVYASVSLWAAVKFLPETMPPEKRMQLSAKNVVQSYKTIFSDSEYAKLIVAIGANFSGFFLYLDEIFKRIFEFEAYSRDTALACIGQMSLAPEKFGDTSLLQKNLMHFYCNAWLKM
ncbi:Pyrroloquinoline-quinone synthase [Nymphon striatum]|nr:Pyrroloquinoline-quinone synthase [Nymphon striatum]